MMIKLVTTVLGLLVSGVTAEKLDHRLAALENKLTAINDENRPLASMALVPIGEVRRLLTT